MEIEVNHRCDVKGQGLREKQASNDCDSQRTASFTTYTSAECDRKGSRSAAIVVIMIGRKRWRQPR